MLLNFSELLIEILTTITWVLDFIAVTIIAVSVFQALMSKAVAGHQYDFSFSSLLNGHLAQKKKKFFRKKEMRGNNSLRGLVRGLLLALEFESASAIIKLGIFMTNITILSEPISTNLGNFAFFVGIFALRIVLNQSLRRFNTS
ncbi:hypothetical protein [Candidatus Nitrosocosmicus franklandus]|uniref:Uncharacterized protein n=1 Tax=Candidatus Nitrosocosmicus franklandianus TaxID=1798806 RepID=A0A484I954_9ARCH|nr:hypothetical protein [Candidatus Nitrosocosmicus franklandus]VFJ14250.1 membrane protein of unknown function [Candidatus Nitrosocosmicus franklandus]